MKRLFSLFIGLGTFAQMLATSADSIQISLLTVLPRTNAVYTVFGHTALRVRDLAQGTDVVYNWGLFSFSEPNFIGRFVQGKAHYFLGVAPYNQFIYSYKEDGATMLEQVLTFTPEGITGLLNAIEENLRPENRVYLYSYVFDNCTTRVRDLLEQFSDNKLTYKEIPENMQTFRRQLHNCIESDMWLTFGIDLLLGSGVDSLVSSRSTSFLPLRLKEAVDVPAQTIIAGGTVVSESTVIAGLTRNPLTTVCAALGVLLALAMIFFLPRWTLSPLYLVAALAGCVVFYLNFFSLHPCVSHNFNLLWLNPLYFIALAGCFTKKHYRIITWYHAVNIALLLLFLLLWAFGWLPQTFNMLNLAFIIPLLAASVKYCTDFFGSTGNCMGR